jgi:hypothetical protein
MCTSFYNVNNGHNVAGNQNKTRRDYHYGIDITDSHCATRLHRRSGKVTLEGHTVGQLVAALAERFLTFSRICMTIRGAAQLYQSVRGREQY